MPNYLLRICDRLAIGLGAPGLGGDMSSGSLAFLCAALMLSIFLSTIISF
jgi:hypothetical protein